MKHKPVSPERLPELLRLQPSLSAALEMLDLPFDKWPQATREAARLGVHDAVGALLEAKAIHPGRSARDHLRWLADSNGIGRRRVDEVLDDAEHPGGGRSPVSKGQARRPILLLRLSEDGSRAGIRRRSYPPEFHAALRGGVLCGLRRHHGAGP